MITKIPYKKIWKIVILPEDDSKGKIVSGSRYKWYGECWKSGEYNFEYDSSSDSFFDFHRPHGHFFAIDGTKSVRKSGRHFRCFVRAILSSAAFTIRCISSKSRGLRQFCHGKIKFHHSSKLFFHLFQYFHHFLLSIFILYFLKIFLWFNFSILCNLFLHFTVIFVFYFNICIFLLYFLFDF